MRAYRTVSADALQVLVGAPPMDLVIRERTLCFLASKGEQINYGGFGSSPTMTLLQVKRGLKMELLEEWNKRWSLSAKGRVTHEYFPDVRQRLSQNWISPGYYVTQALTGHGNFAGKLHLFSLVETPDCVCGLPDTSEHILYDCNNYNEYRQEFISELASVGIPWPLEKHYLMGEKIFPIYAKYVERVLKIKESIDT